MGPAIICSLIVFLYMAIGSAVAIQAYDRSNTTSPKFDGWICGLFWPVTVFFGYFMK